MLNRILLVVIALGAGACAKAVHVDPVEPKDRRHRPSWTANVAVHIDGARACLEGREAPHFVAHIEPLSTGAVGFTTADAYGSLQNCAYADGKVLRREESPLRASQLAGLPMLSIGASQPVLPAGAILEEVLDGDTVVGWLFWAAPSNDRAEL